MDSLKQETQGLQKEKEVRFFISWCLYWWLSFNLIVFVLIVKIDQLEEKVWTFYI